MREQQIFKIFDLSFFFSDRDFTVIQNGDAGGIVTPVFKTR
jgi:hypothetical protein